jgi:hypothetical protein
MRLSWIAVFLLLPACGPRVVDPACARYISCQAAFDDATGLEPVDTSVYAEDGDCWAGDPTAADRCAAECEANADAVRQAAADADLTLDACAVEPSP